MGRGRPEAGGPPGVGVGTTILTRPALCLAATLPRLALEGSSAVNSLSS